MNFIIGESHPYFMFPSSEMTNPKPDIYTIKSDQWLGMLYYSGKTIYRAIDMIEDDLESVEADVSSCENMVYVFGTNDAARKVKDRVLPEVFIPKYVAFTEYIRDKYKIKNVYIATPFYIRDTRSFDPHQKRLNDAETSNPIIEDIGYHILKETEKYSNIHAIEMLNIFNEGGFLFNNQYCKDGIHFNEVGKEMYFKKIYEAIASVDNNNP